MIKLFGNGKGKPSFFEEFLERSEQKWYMSPFELMFCTFYQDIFRAAKYSKEQLEKWYEVSKDQEKGRNCRCSWENFYRAFFIR